MIAMVLTSHAMLNDYLRASKQTICLQFVYRTHDAAMADRLSEKCQNVNERSLFPHQMMPVWSCVLMVWSAQTICRVEKG